MFRIDRNLPILINKPVKPINIDKNKLMELTKKTEQESFDEVMKQIEKPKFIQPSIERQKKILLKKSQELESVLVLQMMKVMKPKTSDGMFGGGQAEEIWSDMLYEEYSKTMSQNANFGLSDQIYKELSSHLDGLVY